MKASDRDAVMAFAHDVLMPAEAKGGGAGATGNGDLARPLSVFRARLVLVGDRTGE